MGAQNEDETFLCSFVAVACQPNHTTRDCGKQIDLPALTYDNTCKDDQKIAFYISIPNRMHFNASFNGIKDEAEIYISRKAINISNIPGGRRRSLPLIG